MKATRWLLISVVDWLDDDVFQHRFLRLCGRIGASLWWPEDDVALRIWERT